MHAHLAYVASRQDGIVTWRQLRTRMSESQVLREVRPFRQMHDGVWLAAFAPPTQRQRHRAAVLTEPGTVLAGASATAFYELRESPGSFEVVVRGGTSGPRRIGDLLVLTRGTSTGNGTGWPASPSSASSGWSSTSRPISEWRRRTSSCAKRSGAGWSPSTLFASRGRGSPGAAASAPSRGGCRPTDISRSTAAAAMRRPGGSRSSTTRGSRSPTSTSSSKASKRTSAGRRRSSRARGIDVPHGCAGLIVEIDGPQWHRDHLLDALKTTRWRSAGWELRRVPSDAVFDSPPVLVAAASAPIEHAWTLV